MKIIGIGGAGTNSLNNMIQHGFEGMEFIAVNTDSEGLKKSNAETNIQIGKKLLQGKRTDASPDLGRMAALEERHEIRGKLSDHGTVCIMAGLGGGTGTGAAPVIADIAKEKDLYVITVVTMPFSFEGKVRYQNAKKGLSLLKMSADMFIVIECDRLRKGVPENTSMHDFYMRIDDAVYRAVQSIGDLVYTHGN